MPSTTPLINYVCFVLLFSDDFCAYSHLITLEPVGLQTLKEAKLYGNGNQPQVFCYEVNFLGRHIIIWFELHAWLFNVTAIAVLFLKNRCRPRPLRSNSPLYALLHRIAFISLTYSYLCKQADR